MPVTAAVALLGWAAGLAPAGGLTGPQRWTAAFFGARGVGSLYYLAYAAGKAPELGQGLWSTVAVTWSRPCSCTASSRRPSCHASTAPTIAERTFPEQAVGFRDLADSTAERSNDFPARCELGDRRRAACLTPRAPGLHPPRSLPPLTRRQSRRMHSRRQRGCSRTPHPSDHRCTSHEPVELALQRERSRSSGTSSRKCSEWFSRSTSSQSRWRTRLCGHS